MPTGRILPNAALNGDIGTIAATSGSSGSIATPTITVMSTPTAQKICPSGVSTGVAAGIGAGVGIPLLLAAIAFMAMFLRERKKNTVYRAQTQQITANEIGGRTINGKALPSEVADTYQQRHELSI